MTTFAYTWNGTFLATPADTEEEALGAQRIRDTKAAVGERVAIDHSLLGNTDDGKHLWVTLPPQASANAMTLDATNGRVFTAVVGGSTELFYQDSNSAVTQLTSGGAINLTGKFVGEIFLFGGSTAPALCLSCNGANVSRTTYALLFAAIGTTYGVGDNSTTFTLPDARGRVVVAPDGGQNRLTSASIGTAAVAGAVGGNELLHSHFHDVSETPHSHTLDIHESNGGTSGYQGTNSGPFSNTTSAVKTNLTIDAAGNGNSQNVQPTLVVGGMFIFAGV